MAKSGHLHYSYHREKNLPPRSYEIQLPSGRITRRNRRDLLKTPEKDIYRRKTDEDWDINFRQTDRQRTADLQIDHIPNMPVLPSSPKKPVPKPVHNNDNTHKVKSTPTPPLSPPSPIKITRSGRESKPPTHLQDYVK